MKWLTNTFTLLTFFLVMFENYEMVNEHIYFVNIFFVMFENQIYTIHVF